MSGFRSHTVSFIRGLAIIGVVLVHSPQSFDGINPVLKNILSIGQLGCQAFFVMSSYCLCLSVEKKGQSSFLPFIRNKFFTLAPAYWCTLCINFLFVILSLLLGFKLVAIDTTPLYIATNLLLLHGCAPLYFMMNGVVPGGWFVGTLMICYCLFPLMYKFYNQRGPLWWCKYRKYLFLLLITIACWIVMLLTSYGRDTICELGSAKYFYVVNQLPSFALGFTLYDLSKNGSSRHVMCKLVLATVALITVFYSQYSFSNMVSPLLSALVASYLFLLIDQKGYSASGNLFAFISKIGDRSYSIYLSHFWIVFPAITIIKHCVGIGATSSSVTLTYLILLPFMLLAIYSVSIYYDRMISFLTIKVKTLFGK